MNIIAQPNTTAYAGYDYPVVPQIPDDALNYHGQQRESFENGRFHHAFQFGRYVVDFDADAELYNAEKKSVINPMQAIGTLIDIYA